jgi:hypothetical protein
MADLEYINEIKVTLLISSLNDMDNVVISKILKTKATKTRKKGALIYPSPCIAKYKYNGWVYQVKKKNIASVEHLLNKLINLFINKKDELNKIRASYGAGIEISIVGYLKKGIPSIHFSQESLNFIHSINAEIDIDLYGL